LASSGVINLALTWIYIFPAWAVVAAAILTFGCIAVLMVTAFRFFVKTERRHNDVAGPIFGLVGTILAVLLSFTLVTVWVEYDQASQSAFNEAAAVSDLYNLAPYFPQPTRSKLRNLIRRYVAAVDVEWRLMRIGKSNAEVTGVAAELLAALVEYQSKTVAGNALQSLAIDLINAAQDARRDRLFDNQQGIPIVLWAGILFIVLITLLLCSSLYAENRVMHMVLAGGLGGVIAVVLTLTAEFDYPFRGDIQIPPTAWQSVQTNLLKR
jgi:uncharacterized membrane-anchored protein